MTETVTNRLYINERDFAHYLRARVLRDSAEAVAPLDAF